MRNIGGITGAGNGVKGVRRVGAKSDFRVDFLDMRRWQMTMRLPSKEYYAGGNPVRRSISHSTTTTYTNSKKVPDFGVGCGICRCVDMCSEKR